jgi:limonene 1,2-monooxygenase
MLLRDRQDEAMGIIRKLLNGEDRFSYESDWFKLRDAKLHLRPLQRDMEFAVASMVSPSGMTLAGKHQAGVLSIGAMVPAGMRSLPTQWSFAEESAKEHGNTVERKNWRIVMNWHIAETREDAREQAKEGLFKHNNEYSVAALNPDEGITYKTPDDAVDAVAFSEGSTAVIGTPDDLVAKIKEMISITGGFGCVIGFVHDWANRENTLKSWDLVARYVVPEINGLIDDYRDSYQFVTTNRETWTRAREAVMNKINSNNRSAEIMETQGYEGEKSKP